KRAKRTSVTTHGDERRPRARARGPRGSASVERRERGIGAFGKVEKVELGDPRAAWGRTTARGCPSGRAGFSGPYHFYRDLAVRSTSSARDPPPPGRSRRAFRPGAPRPGGSEPASRLHPDRAAARIPELVAGDPAGARPGGLQGSHGVLQARKP